MTTRKAETEETGPGLTPEAQAMAEMIAALQAKLQALEARVGQKIEPDEPVKMIRPDTPEPGGAWVVKAPSEDYNGETAGIKFTNGWGVVYPDMPDAARRVHQLEHDFKYGVLAVDAQTLAEFQKRMTAGAPAKAPGVSAKLAVAQVLGGGS